MRLRFLALMLLVGATACGQRGDLFLRENPPPGYRPPAEQFELVPYPEDILPPEQQQK